LGRGTSCQCPYNNEAFAAVPLVSLEVLTDKDKAADKALHKKTNMNGSAIAIGHPNTASGARIIMNLMYELKRDRPFSAG